ncbi:MAG: acetylxylan esterase [Mycobacteriales bacterium]
MPAVARRLLEVRRSTSTRLRVLLLVLLGALTALTGTAVVTARPAAAASLVQVTNFGTNPTNLGMFLYVPNNVAPNPAILVAVHFCTGSGPVFFSGTEFASLADRFGFIVIYPSATRSGACFDVSSPGALTHNGNSDPVGIVSMVRWVEQNRGGDPNRVYVSGASSGGMMTNVLLGDYPDVFKAGAAFMGVPFSCFATTDGSMWNTACANGQVSKTPQQWGDAVRNAFPGFTGARPRMQLWHGTADATLFFPNFGEEIKQWTNVLGVSQTPASTDTPQSGWTHTKYGNTSAMPPVEAYSISGVGHSLPMSGMAAQAIRFFGLDGTTTPPTTTPPTTTPPVNDPPPTTTNPPGGGCTVTDVISAWNTGLTANMTIRSSTAVNGWSLRFTLPAGQTITSGWNATYSSSSGQVTATNVSYNGSIPANGSTSIGFQANHTGNTGKPTAVTLNGTPCTVA